MNANTIREEYENEIRSLKSEIELYKKRCDQYCQAYEQMHHQLKELLRNRFGKKSERYIDSDNTQLGLFETQPFPQISKVSEETKVSAHSRKKNKTKKELPRKIEIIPVSEDKKQCPCGCVKT
jgi:transposase